MSGKTAEQLAAGERNRLRAYVTEQRMPRMKRLMKFFPPDTKEQLYERGVEPRTGSGHVAYFDGLYRVEITARIGGREVRVSATAECGEDLFPNLLRAFG